MYKVKLDGYVLYHADHPSAMLTDPVLELEPGYAGVFTATVPPDNPLYDRIYCRKSMLSVFRNNTEIFYGEVRKIPNIDRYRNKQIYCTGALSFLADSIQPQAEYHDISPAALLGRMLEIHNSQVEPRKQIKLGYVSITDPNNSLYRYTNYENTLEAIRDKLVGRLGGYLRLRHEGDQLILDWVGIEQYGNYSTQPIEFGLNLLDYSETTSAEDVVTALIPLGATLEGESEIEALEKRVDITSVNDGKNYVFSQDAVDQFGWVWATNTWDDVTVPANLKTKAEEWLSSTQFETMSLKLTAADLSELGHDYDAFAEGDRIHCLAKPYGMPMLSSRLWWIGMCMRPTPKLSESIPFISTMVRHCWRLFPMFLTAAALIIPVIPRKRPTLISRRTMCSQVGVPPIAESLGTPIAMRSTSISAMPTHPLWKAPLRVSTQMTG